MTGEFADGERSLPDLIAPGSFEERRDMVMVDGRASRVHVLADYPRSVYPNWLAPLLDRRDPIDFSLHVHPVPSREAGRALDRRLVQLQSSRMLRARAGRLASSESELAYSDTEDLRAAVERGAERIFQVSGYFRVYGQSQAELDDASARAESELGAMLASVQPALFEQLPGLLSCMPSGQDHLRRVRNMDTTSAATMLPFASSQAGDRDGILSGFAYTTDSPVIIDPFGRPNANKVVFASSGAGKSYYCKLEMERSLLAGIHYYVIDPEREYEPLAEALGAQTIRVSGASRQHINPFDLPQRPADAPPDDDEPDPLAAQVLSLHGLLALMLTDEDGRGPTPRERGLLDRAIYDTYAGAGINSDPATHANPPPLIGELVALLRERDDPSGLADRLAIYAPGGSLGSMFGERTTVTFDSPAVVFDTRDLEDAVRPLAIYVIANHIWREVRSRPRRRLLLIDEAWTLLKHRAGADFIERMARQARKHWLGLIVNSQDVGDFLGSEAGQVVLNNSATKLLLRQDPSVIDSVAQAFALSPVESAFLTGAERGEGVMILGGDHVPLRVVASPLEHALITTDPRERQELSARGAAGPQ